MGEVSQWGLGFMKAIERTPARWQERLAGLAVCSIAREALLTGQISRAAKERAKTILRPVTDIPIRSWTAQMLRCANPSVAHWPLGIARALNLYGMELHKDGDWSAAINAFTVVADSPHVDRDSRLRAMERRAFAARIGNLSPYAEMAYGQLYEFALEWGEESWALRARKGLACVAVHRGRYGEAQHILHSVLDAAERSRNTALAGDVYQDLAWIAGLRHDYMGAFRYAMKAARLSDRPEATRRAIHNVAEAYAGLGDDGAIANATYLLDWLDETKDLEERREADDLRHTLEVPSHAELTGLGSLADAVHAAVGEPTTDRPRRLYQYSDHLTR